MSRAEEKANEYADKCMLSVNHRADVRDAYWDGYEQAEKDLGWRSVKESLPPMDEEVIVLLADYGEVRMDPLYMIAFGHIVDTERCIDYNGWNIPGVRFWMPIPEIPKK